MKSCLRPSREKGRRCARDASTVIQFLKEENKILRSRLPGQVHTKPAERERHIKFGKALGRAIEELITIVCPSTFYRWLREEGGQPKRKKNSKGGQRKPREFRELVLQIASVTGFGLTRIVGELRKLGIKKVSRQTVRNILKEEGIPPGPDRTSDSWANFVDRHKQTLWACDFFSVKTVTPRGLKEMYVMVWLCLTTREAIVSESTEHPNSAWVVKQTESFLDQTMNREEKPCIVMHDRDAKFSRDFVAKLNEHGVRHNALPKASPNLNGRCKRIIQTIKLECLARFIVFGKRQLDHLCSEFTEYYNRLRSHRERDSRVELHRRLASPLPVRGMMTVFLHVGSSFMPVGFVYVLFNPSIPGKVKIGLTTGTSEERAKSLYETGVADRFHVVYDELVSDCEIVEHKMHERFKGFRKNKKREFFEIPIKDAVRALQEVAKPYLVPESALKNRCEILTLLKRKFPGVLRQDLSSVSVIQLPMLFVLESRRRGKRGETEELVVREDLGFLSGIEDIFDLRYDVKTNAKEFIGNLNLATLLVISEKLFNEEGLAKATEDYNAG